MSEELDGAFEWRCIECDDEFTTFPTRHDPSTCECGEAFVDHEEEYIRTNFKVEAVNPEENRYAP